MNDFYAPVGPRMKSWDGHVTGPLLINLCQSLVGLLSLLLVPLLYVAIFRARKKHAMAIGESANTVIWFTPNTSGISERERIRRTNTNIIGTQIHFSAWFIDVSSC